MKQETIFRKIGYLNWARDYIGQVKYDLARSTLKEISLQELGIDLSKITLSRSNYRSHSDLVQLLAQKYNLPSNCIKITYGATMGLFAVYSSLLERGDEILLELPNYEPLYRIPQRLGIVVKMLERAFERNFQIDLEELQRHISKSTKAIVLSNLHNPTGVETSTEKLRAISQIARDYKTYVICSEVYLDNTFDQTLVPAATIADNMISINSLSKVYGLEGVRIGWVATQNERLIEKIRTICNDYIAGDISTITESIALAALTQREKLLARSRELIKRNIGLISDWIGSRGDLNWLEPVGGTVCFVKLPPVVDSFLLSNLLREKYSTLVAPGEFFWKKGFIRISFGCDSDILMTGLNNISQAISDLLRR